MKKFMITLSIFIVLMFGVSSASALEFQAELLWDGPAANQLHPHLYGGLILEENGIEYLYFTKTQNGVTPGDFKVYRIELENPPANGQPATEINIQESTSTYAETTFAITPDMQYLLTAPYPGSYTLYDYHPDPSNPTITVNTTNYTGYSRTWVPMTQFSYNMIADNDFFYVAKGPGTNAVQKLNIADNSTSDIIFPGSDCITDMEFDSQGNLYAISHYGKLYKYDGENPPEVVLQDAGAYLAISTNTPEDIIYLRKGSVVQYGTLSDLGNLQEAQIIDFPYDPTPGPHYFLEADHYGNLYTGKYNGGDSIYRLTTSDPVEPIPEPATMLLLGSGLIGLAGARRRFIKK